MKEHFLIINPTAAGGRVEKIWKKKLKPILDEKLDYDYEFTTHPGHAIDIARTRVNEGYKVICSVSGDGTANEVINGILKADKLGIYAAFTVGTGNDIATVFGVPEGDINALIDCLINGKDKKFDIGYCQVADRYFAGVASMGFDAEVADRSNKGDKKRSGTRNYQIAIFKTLLKFKPYNIIIEPDSSEPISGPRMLIAIGNGKRYGGGMHICPDASPDDGKFHGTTLKKISRLSLIRLFPRTYDGKHMTHKAVETFEGTRIRVSSPDNSCLYQVDGEILGFLPETFISKPSLLTVRVPDPWLSYTEIWRKKLEEKQRK
ncbi:MAG: diacylglycerol/lipid kinase family protein [Candidatus Hodarchaeales archaeon]